MKEYRFLPWIFFLLIAALLGYTFLDYGMTWDEGVYLSYGNRIYNYYASLGRDRSYNNLLNLRYYGGFFDLVSAGGFHLFRLLLSKINIILSIRNICEVKHLFNILFALAGLVSVFFLGKRLNDPWGGYLATGVLMLIPRYYGHMFNNPKDAPFAAMFALSVWAAVYYVENMESPLFWKRAGFLSLSTGLCCGIRIAGGVVFLLLGILLLGKLAIQKKLTDFELLGKEIILLILTIVSAYLVMMIGWPWAQESVFNPLAALEYFSHFKYGNIPYLYFGRVVQSWDTPWHYIPVWMGITIPVLTMVLFFAGVISIMQNLKSFSIKSLPKLVFLLWFFLPICIIIFKKTYLYDELRQLLFIFPALALVATEGLLFLWQSVGRVKVNYAPRIRLAAGALLLFGFMNIAWNMYELHPYETVYFNEVIGGLKGAYRQFDTDYWCNSFKEAAMFLNRNAPRPAMIMTPSYSNPVCLFYYLDDGFINVLPSSKRFDYMVINTRINTDLNLRHDGETIFQVERQGVPLTIIKKAIHSPLKKGGRGDLRRN